MAADEDSICYSEYVTVNGVNTHVLKYDREEKESHHRVHAHHGSHSKEHDVLVLVIPGNPGVVGFYELFMETLYEASGRQVPVWGISHAGHEMTPDMKKTHWNWNTDDSKYTLKGQVKHKVEFIDKYVPPEKKLILIGHSIGCYFILEILKRMPHLNVLKCIMLFPTIEGMWDSPKGTWMAPILVYLRWAALLPVVLLSYLSAHVQWSLILWYFRGRNVAPCTYNATMNLFSPVCVSNQMYMAACEMKEVVLPDLETIRHHLPKLLFYYGATDHWCPVSYYEKMKRIFPHGDIRLCKRGFKHAFCLESSEEMADMVWSWIKDEVTKIHK
ncbi:lipid droplet-associated hydrolase-like [Ptychodera flava]|uniref:lipid droplet-associated hydrolase-like n=1 Tax=Ptychodera flava TaxID=63121 RepID=UPI00396A7E45